MSSVTHRMGCNWNNPAIQKCDCGADVKRCPHCGSTDCTNATCSMIRVGQQAIKERAKIRGDFRDQAKFSQALKFTFRRAEGWDKLSCAQKEALDNMANKMARILTGDPNEADSWLDLIGYPTIIHNIITKGSTT